MTARVYSSEGVVLATRDYREADRIIILFSKDYGKLSLLAKGVRKPKSKKRGHLQVFSKVKFSASRGKGLDIITEAEIINNFSSIRKNLKKVSLVYYFMEVTGRVTEEEEKSEELYSMILDYLQRLEKANQLLQLRKDFINKILVVLGFWPRGKRMSDPDKILENVIERDINSARVGKKILS